MEKDYKKCNNMLLLLSACMYSVTRGYQTREGAFLLLPYIIKVSYRVGSSPESLC